MLEDDDFRESVEHIIHSQEVNAEYAVAATGDNFSAMFAAMDDDYMRERAADVKDISERVLAVLNGRNEKQVMACLLYTSINWRRQRGKIWGFSLNFWSLLLRSSY